MSKILKIIITISIKPPKRDLVAKPLFGKDPLLLKACAALVGREEGAALGGAAASTAIVASRYMAVGHYDNEERF